MNDLKPLSTSSDYERALEALSDLIAQDPDPRSETGTRLTVLALLVQKYEDEHFHFELPTPSTAIKFRMDQLNLKQKDLVDFIGSKSKVSEVLSGKRSLSLSMIRNLSEGLRIPADVLIRREPSVSEEMPRDMRHLLRFMVRNGWIGDSSDLEQSPLQMIDNYLSILNPINERGFVWYRRGAKESRNAQTLDLLQRIWLARVLYRSTQSTTEVYREGTVDRELMVEIARLSQHRDGPRRACVLLEKLGVQVIVQHAPPGSQIDGALVMSRAGTPVVGLTLRFDRVDNFWFTLMHELAHLSLHVLSSRGVFLDDLEKKSVANDLEREADLLAREALVPRSVWRTSDAHRQRTQDAVRRLAEQVGIHPAIVAGMIRRESGNYSLFTEMLGMNEIRHQFDQ